MFKIPFQHRRNRYILITVVDRMILTEHFTSLNDARIQMHKEMIEEGKIPADLFASNGNYSDSGCDFGFWEYGGYSNIGINHADYDWLIIPTEENDE